MTTTKWMLAAWVALFIFGVCFIFVLTGWEGVGILLIGGVIAWLLMELGYQIGRDVGRREGGE